MATNLSQGAAPGSSYTTAEVSSWSDAETIAQQNPTANIEVLGHGIFDSDGNTGYLAQSSSYQGDDNWDYSTSPTDLEESYTFGDNNCYYCGMELSEDHLSLEQIGEDIAQATGDAYIDTYGLGDDDAASEVYTDDGGGGESGGSGDTGDTGDSGFSGYSGDSR